MITGINKIEAFEKGHKDHGRFFFRFENKQQINDYLHEQINQLICKALEKCGTEADINNLIFYIPAHEGDSCVRWNGGFRGVQTNIVQIYADYDKRNGVKHIKIAYVFRSTRYKSGGLMIFHNHSDGNALNVCLSKNNYSTTTDIFAYRFPAWLHDVWRPVKY